MTERNHEPVFDSPPDEAAEAMADAEAEADFAAGRVIPHERVREWLLKLAMGEKVAPPSAWFLRVRHASRRPTNP